MPLRVNNIGAFHYFKQPIANALTFSGVGDLMQNGEVRTVQELANKVNVERSYVTRIINPVNLAPCIQAAILDGREPDGFIPEAATQ